jgi:hypothetical protein
MDRRFDIMPSRTDDLRQAEKGSVILPKPLRVLYLNHTTVMGGGEFQVLQMSRALRARGCHVTVACHVQNSIFRHTLQNAGISVYPISPMPFFCGYLANLRIAIGFLLALGPLLKEFRPDIIGANTLVTAIVAALLNPHFPDELVNRCPEMEIML